MRWAGLECAGLAYIELGWAGLALPGLAWAELGWARLGWVAVEWCEDGAVCGWAVRGGEGFVRCGVVFG